MGAMDGNRHHLVPTEVMDINHLDCRQRRQHRIIQDPLDQDLAKVLGALAEARVPDLAQRERLVAEGLRQLRMLSHEERLRTLRLMEAQLAPVKR